MSEPIRDTAALHLEDVYRVFGSHVVLDNIDLTVDNGELVTVVGPSGCGKSTMLRIIIGQDAQTRGTALLKGQRLGTPDRRRGVVYQHYSLFPHLSAVDNVLMGQRMKVWPWQWRKERAAHLDEAMGYMEVAGMAEHAKKFPHQLSGGQRQRIAIIQALIGKPEILCMDEPFSALDPGTREDMQMFLLEMWERYQMTVFFVTHDLEEALYLGTRLIGLSQYYTDARGEGENTGRGARIVVDRQIRPIGQVISPSVKATAEFGELLQDIRLRAFDPDYRQHIKEFDLSHPHSWSTLTPEESE